MRALSPLMEAAVAALQQRDPFAPGSDPLEAVFQQAKAHGVPQSRSCYCSISDHHLCVFAGVFFFLEINGRALKRQNLSRLGLGLGLGLIAGPILEN